MAWLDRIPLWILVAVWEKLKMLAAGTLRRPLDVFDLLYHAAPWVLLALKLVRLQRRR
ncbi:MAG: hypothetical protein MUF32_07135 [Burkholderiaceae bacterium]|nr:hypothetical protein [Burkholderiaceae bacterium]